MNIGIVVTNFDASEGTGGYTVELVRRIAAAHEVTLYASRVQTAPPGNVNVIPVPAVRGRDSLLNLTFPLAFAAVRHRHDVVHAQGWTALSADVVTAHIVFAAWREAVARAGGARGAGERVFGGLVEAGERRLMQHGARHVIAPSAQAKAAIARCYGRRDNVTVIPHGFPRPGAPQDRTAARREFGVPPQGFAALYAGDVRKGLMTALAATARSNNRLLVASRSGVAPYQRRASELGIADRVHWLGSLPSIGVALAAVDVLLHPTIYDSFGLVVAEAMAAGVAPIVTRHAGVSELIAHRQSGWLLGDDVVGDAAQALTTLAGDPALLAALAREARAVAAGRTWDDVARETLLVYEAARR